MGAMKFRDVVAQKVDDWSFVELIEPGVNDKSWFLRWCAQLDKASAAVIIFTDTYKRKMKIVDTGGCRMEAFAIRKRLQRWDSWRQGRLRHFPTS